MRSESDSSRRKRRPPKPLDAARMDELALSYVARFATSSGKLSAYLARKLRERGWDGDSRPDVQGLVERFIDKGFIDDEAWARARSGGLQQRGYGTRRIAQDLNAAGIAEDVREAVAPDEAEARRAAAVLARKRRFGPFTRGPLDRPLREKQLAAMVRAGHSFDAARALVDAPGEADVERWLAEAEETGS